MDTDPRNDRLGLDEPSVDSLTRFGNRRKLVADVALALEPHSEPSVLAVFFLAGSRDYRRFLGQAAGDALIVRLAEQFARLVPEGAICYRSRDDEFGVLLSTPVDEVSAMLDATAGALRDEGHSFLITAAFGAALLPDEAEDPTEALMLADERLQARLWIREERDRRHTARTA
jgi:GGDEF domain-containing protein